MAKPEKEEVETEREAATDGPLLDLSDDAVKKMIKAAKKRGYVTMDELNSVLPSEEVTSEQIEDTCRCSPTWASTSSRTTSGRRGRSRPIGRRRRGRRQRAGRADRHRGCRHDHQERADRPHRRSGAHVSARDGLGRASVARGRNRHRQAHRGRPRDDDRGPVRKPADLPGHHHLARRAQRSEDPAARHHRSRSDLCRPGGQAGAGGGAQRGCRRSRSVDEAQPAPSAPQRDDDDITNVGGDKRGRRRGRGRRGRGRACRSRRWKRSCARR